MTMDGSITIISNEGTGFAKQVQVSEGTTMFAKGVLCLIGGYGEQPGAQRPISIETFPAGK